MTTTKPRTPTYFEVRCWSQEEVSAWLHYQLRLPDCAEEFRNAQIDGEKLVGLSELQIKQLMPGVDIQERRKIMKTLKDINQNTTNNKTDKGLKNLGDPKRKANRQLPAPPPGGAAASGAHQRQQQHHHRQPLGDTDDEGGWASDEFDDFADDYENNPQDSMPHMPHRPGGVQTNHDHVDEDEEDYLTPDSTMQAPAPPPAPGPRQRNASFHKKTVPPVPGSVPDPGPAPGPPPVLPPRTDRANRPVKAPPPHPKDSPVTHRKPPPPSPRESAPPPVPPALHRGSVPPVPPVPPVPDDDQYVAIDEDEPTANHRSGPVDEEEYTLVDDTPELNRSISDRPKMATPPPSPGDPDVYEDIPEEPKPTRLVSQWGNKAKKTPNAIKTPPAKPLPKMPTKEPPKEPKKAPPSMPSNKAPLPPPPRHPSDTTSAYELDGSENQDEQVYEEPEEAAPKSVPRPQPRNQNQPNKKKVGVPIMPQMDINTQRIKEVQLRPSITPKSPPAEKTDINHNVDASGDFKSMLAKFNKGDSIPMKTPMTVSPVKPMGRVASQVPPVGRVTPQALPVGRVTPQAPPVGRVASQVPPAPPPARTSVSSNSSDSGSGEVGPMSPRKMSSVDLPLPPLPGQPGGVRGPLPQPPGGEQPLKSCPWYFGDLNRNVASDKVMASGAEGGFLIRDSARDPSNPYTLCLCYNQRLWNLHIRKRKDGLFALGNEKDNEKTFKTVQELVNFHRLHSIVLAGSRGGETVLGMSPK